MELQEAGVLVLDCEHKTPKGKESGFPYIAIPDIVDGRVNLSSARRISSEDLHIWTRRTKPRAGDILVTRRGRVGDTAPIPAEIDCAIGQNLVLLRSDEVLVSQDYLRWATRGPMWSSEVDRLMNVGAVFSSLNVRDISRLRIPVPPKQVQVHIAAVLGALDDKIVVNDRIARTSRELGQAMFAGCLKSSTLQMVELAEVTAAITRGITPKYSDDDDAVVVLNQKCVRDGRVTLDPARKTLPEKIREPKLLRRDDVLVNSTGVGTLGRVARWTIDMRATTDSHVTIVRFDPAKVDPVCGGFALLAAQPDIEALGEGSTGQTELSRKRLGEYQIALPSPQAMQQLRPNLDSLEAKVQEAMEQSKTLAELRDALLPKLMSGQIRIRDAEKVVEEAV
ncbi:restriction endonuclease subunit S [Actinomadura geliboluensis]|uniref:restriction endonuclease subunit S n=1 Tax=Actinomadura geliboluensis TaxID=882440 RepID=UPI0036798855